MKEHLFYGGIDFNFSKKRDKILHRVKYEHFKKLLEFDKDFHGKLDKCFNMYHSQYNISLMPQEGNLQGAKGTIAYDMLNTWVYLLWLYYDRKEILLLNHSTAENIECLKSFLNTFDTVYEYCDAIYHINCDLVDKLIKLGNQPIDSVTRVKEYMELANEFWKQKKSYIESNIK